MRKLSLAFILAFSQIAFAGPKSDVVLVDLEFRRDKQVHEFLITQTNSKDTKFILLFKENGKIKKTSQITKNQAMQLKSDATRIIWENQYRKPASASNCHEYLSLQTNVDKSKICYENQSSTGKAYGFLNNLNSYLR